MWIMLNLIKIWQDKCVSVKKTCMSVSMESTGDIWRIKGVKMWHLLKFMLQLNMHTSFWLSLTCVTKICYVTSFHHITLRFLFILWFVIIAEIITKILCHMWHHTTPFILLPVLTVSYFILLLTNMPR